MIPYSKVSAAGKTSLLVLSILLSSCGIDRPHAADEVEQTYPVYESFELIPSVTQEEIDAIRRLQKDHPEGFTLGMTLSTECFPLRDAADGCDVGGYAALFCALLSGMFDIQFTPQIYRWDDLMNGLNDNSIDFTCELTRNQERNDLYMTDNITERTVKFMRIINNPKFLELPKNRMHRYAIWEGGVVEERIKDAGLNNFVSIYVQNFEEIYRLLKSGEIDAFIHESVSEAAFDVYGDVVAENFFPVIFSQTSLATHNQELRPVVSIVQKFLRTEASKKLSELYHEGYQQYLHRKLFDLFSPGQLRYIENHNSAEMAVPIVAEYDNYPVSFFNKQEKQWQGIAFDVLNAIENMTGLKFTVINETDAPRDALIDMIRNGEASLIANAGLENAIPFLSTAPYQSDYFILISRADYPDVNVHRLSFERIGVGAGVMSGTVFRTYFPNHEKLVVYHNKEEAFDALENGAIDLLMGNSNVLLSLTNYHERPGFKANLIFNKSYDVYFGFSGGSTILAYIINKSQKLIDTIGVADRWNRKVFDYRGKMARTQAPYLIASSLFLMTALVLLAILFIKNRQRGKDLEYLVKQRTQELEIQTAAARVASQTKSDFLARMSHEIRTPLNAITGMTAIAKKAAVSDKAIASLNEITLASNHLLGVINDILDMSKIESGKFSLVNEALSLHQMFKEVSELIAQRCREKFITFIQDYERIPAHGVLGDKLRLKQVLINLLGNAVKFTPELGEITLSAALNGETTADMSVTFQVQDSGLGMTEEQCSRLFIPFEQADSSIAVRFGGTGLGLAISQNLVNLMGGRLSVRSSLGKGSTFMFTLILRKTDVSLEESGGLEEMPDFTGKRILLAEDVEINRIIVRELLEDTHVDIEEAVDGQNAFDMFTSSEVGYYDLVLMDIQMPNVDGYQACRMIRALNRRDATSIPIVAMTANAYSEDIDNALKAGMNGHLAKPVDINTMLRTLQASLSHPSGV
jgi:signal transduction histidine kinase/ActR/RegA family two-component response regulator